MEDNDDDERTGHRRAWDLIPWVVGGSASAVERRTVEQHAAGCADCRDEIAFHHQLRAGMVAEAAHDPEPALQRLLARIDQANDTAPVWVSPGSTPPVRGPAWSRWLAAAVVVQAIGLAALIGVVWERPSSADYQTLSRPPEPPATATAAASIRLVPVPSLALVEFQALLARADVQVVNSSADASIFSLDQRPGTTRTIAETLQVLRAEPGVLLAEPIVGADGAGRH